MMISQKCGWGRATASPQFFLPFLILLSLLAAPTFAADPPKVELKKQPGQVEITVGGKPFATYVYADPKISRPYFAHVHAPNGTQVTRNHPPIAGQDKMDHPEFHPGIWMAFGDIRSSGDTNGNDYWRLKAPVKHVDFVTDNDDDTFAVRNQYLSAADPTKVVCEEVCRYQIVPTKFGTFLLWDSTFTSPHDFTFGDQEEMGLGIRVATPMRVEAGDGSIPPGNGTMADADGRKNGEQIGGQTSNWCDYSGTIDGQQVGMTIFPGPGNFRPSWFHARDYGFLAANPFGRAAFKKGEPSKVVVKPGEEFRLRYSILIHADEDGKSPNLNDAFWENVRLSKILSSD
jgi:hypothetical protein